MEFLLDLANPWVYVLVFVLGFAEGAALIGLFLPGETSMLLGGVLVSQGRATAGVMFLAGAAGSALGDSAGFWVGRRFGARVRRSRLGQRVGDDRWRRADSFLAQKGQRAVFVGRFLGFLRTLVPPTAGSSGMSYRRFVSASAPAATIWSVVFIGLGIAAGRSWRVVSEWAGRASLVLLILLAFGVLVFLVVRRLRAHVAGLKRWSAAVIAHPTAQRLRRRFEGQIGFLSRRLDPVERFGLLVTVGLLVALGSVVALGALMDSLAEGGDAASFDSRALAFFEGHQSTRIDPAMRMLAEVGSTRWLIGATVIGIVATAIVTRGWRWLLFGAALLVGALVIDDIAEAGLDLVGVTYSGPIAGKGWLSSAMTVGGAALGGAIYVTGRARAWTTAIAVGGGVLIVLFAAGMAQVYIGEEAPSSILAGVLLGLFWAAISAISSNQIWHLRNRPV